VGVFLVYNSGREKEKDAAQLLIACYSVLHLFVIFTMRKTTKAAMMKVISGTRKSSISNI
jgi:hypothetical protein